MDNESFLDLMARTNAVFNLSEADHLISPHESESDETDCEGGDNPNSDSASSDGEEGDSEKGKNGCVHHFRSSCRKH